MEIFEFIKGIDPQVLSVLTFVVLFIYAFFTILLWKESNSQTKLIISPLLIIWMNPKTNEIFVKNCGKGIAVNIQVESFTLLLTDLPEEWKIIFDLMDFLESGSEKKLIYTGYVNNKKTEGVEDFLLMYFHDENNIKLSVNYFDALGREYFTKIVTGKKGFKIIKIGLNTMLYKIHYELSHFITYRITRIKVHYKRRRNKRLKPH